VALTSSSLLRLLLDYQPIDAPEHTAHRYALTLARDTHRCCDRDHYTPGHFTASGLVLNPDRELLIIWHPKLNQWLQPGGHIESTDASLLDAASREVREETGVRALHPQHEGIFDIDVHPIPTHGATPAHVHVDLRVLYTTSTHALSPTLEQLHARWCPLAQITEVSTDTSMHRIAQKLQRVFDQSASNRDERVR
jgi:8-oxo-dGTP pyrophosphatase MutT (NUDIX family)